MRDTFLVGFPLGVSSFIRGRFNLDRGAFVSTVDTTELIICGVWSGPSLISDSRDGLFVLSELRRRRNGIRLILPTPGRCEKEEPSKEVFFFLFTPKDSVNKET